MVSLRRAYLLVYNFVQLCGWSSILYLLAKSFRDGVAISNLYSTVSGRVEFFQTLACLEIVHACWGIVPSGALTTTIQVLSRLFIVWPVAHTVFEARTSCGAVTFTLAWAVTEVVRYSFYAFAQVRKPIRLITWLRYTLFYGLYPLGVAGELIAIFTSMTPVRQRKLCSLQMPNRLNLTFNFYFILWVVLPLYVLLFPKMYMHMINQRKKVLIEYKKKSM